MHSMTQNQNNEFEKELQKCKLFRLKAPRGGHYNDRFELLGEIKLSNGVELLKTLDMLGVAYTLHNHEPQQWSPPPLIVGNDKHWIVYQQPNSCFGFETGLTIGTTDCTIEFSFNSTNSFEVKIDDIKRAVSFEQVLASHNLLP